VGTIVHTPTNYSSEAGDRSIEGSLRALGTDRLDLLLLHAPRPEDLADGAVVEWLLRQKERGLVRNVGIATDVEAAAGILARHGDVFDVVQVPSDVLAPATVVLGAHPAPLLVTHSVLAQPMARAAARLRADAVWARTLSERAGADVAAPGMLARLLLATGLAENSHGVVLLGSSSEAHLRAAPAAVGAFPPARVTAAAAFLRDSLGAVAR
jgi:aryl-alcohol dehydrogenase-like predicted oxidoreductase